MKLEVKQEHFARALGNVGRVASSKAGLPILNNILLRTDGSQLLLAATNLEIATSQKIGAKIDKPGSLTVPARLLTEFVHNLPKSTVHLEVKQHILHITCDKYTSSINGTQDDEFPELPLIDEKKSVELSIATNDFKEAVNQTIITASSDTTRPVLTGVFWHTYEKQLYLAATDGYRLAEKRLMAIESDIAAIIPTSTLQEVLRTLTDDHEAIDMILDDTQVVFRLQDAEITSRLIDGNFPDYRQLIPKKSDTACEMNKDEFGRIVKIASLFARDSGGTITLKVDSEKNSLTIHSIASELGENTSEIVVKSSGEAGIINLNSRYLHEALNVISAKKIKLQFSGTLSPCLLLPIEKEASYQHIIMPIKG